jgi:hypothetical protein
VAETAGFQANQGLAPHLFPPHLAFFPPASQWHRSGTAYLSLFICQRKNDSSFVIESAEKRTCAGYTWVAEIRRTSSLTTCICYSAVTHVMGKQDATRHGFQRDELASFFVFFYFPSFFFLFLISLYFSFLFLMIARGIKAVVLSNAAGPRHLHAELSSVWCPKQAL